MKPGPPLFLHEEIMLIALRDKKGTTPIGSMHQYAIGGALIAELLLNDRVRIGEPAKKKMVDLVDATPLGDPVLDECLQKIKAAKRRGSIKTWVTRFAQLKKLNQRVAERLCQRGILRVDEDKVLLIFTRTIYPEVDSKPERELVARMRKAIFTGTRDIDPRTTVLIALASNVDLLKQVFDKKKLKDRKARIKQISEGEMASKAAKEAMEAMQAAIMVCCIMPAVTASVITS
jgi:golgi phosphoprotein 3